MKFGEIGREGILYKIIVLAKLILLYEILIRNF